MAALSLQGPASRAILGDHRPQVFPPGRDHAARHPGHDLAAPATPATWATRSGSDSERRAGAVGRADRRRHAARHHAGGHARARRGAHRGRADADRRRLRPGAQGADREPDLQSLRARPRLDGEPEEGALRRQRGARGRGGARIRSGASSASRSSGTRSSACTPRSASRTRLPPTAWRMSVPIYAGAEQVGYATSGGWSPLLKKYIALAHCARRMVDAAAPSSRSRSRSSTGASAPRRAW